MIPAFPTRVPNQLHPDANPPKEPSQWVFPYSVTTCLHCPQFELVQFRRRDPPLLQHKQIGQDERSRKQTSKVVIQGKLHRDRRGEVETLIDMPLCVLVQRFHKAKYLGLNILDMKGPFYFNLDRQVYAKKLRPIYSCAPCVS